MRRALWCLPLLLSLACEEEQISSADPEIHLCPTLDSATADCDRAFDLGELPITVERGVRFAIANRGRAPLDVASVVSDVEWAVVEFDPVLINNGRGVEVNLLVTPPELGENRATLTVQSDDPARPSASLDLLISGIPKPVPEIELCLAGTCERGVDAFAVDFGVVRRTQQEARLVTVRNAGEVELEIESVLVDDGSSVLGELSVESSTRAGTLAPGAEAPLVLVYEPADALADVMILTLRSNDPAVPIVEVQVSGRSETNAPPTALAAQLDTALTAFDATVGDAVVLDGAASSDPEGDPLTFLWSITPPGGSTAELDDPVAGRVIFTPDVAGQYEVNLVVADSLGQTSPSASTVLVDALPEAALRVRLRWSQGGDVDLHLVPTGQALFSASDCHFGAPRPDLGVVNDETDDPSLTDDAELPPGAEEIVFVQPPDGTYQIYVQYFDPADRGAAPVTVDVIGFDQSPTLFTGGITLPDACALWHVGDITFPAGDFVAGSTTATVACAP